MFYGSSNDEGVTVHVIVCVFIYTRLVFNSRKGHYYYYYYCFLLCIILISFS